MLDLRMSLSQILIHREAQFNNQRKKFIDYAGCASSVDLQQITNNLIVIITTQRTGSTLLCQDIESALNLDYSPTESFIPILTGFSKYGIKADDLAGKIEALLQSFAHSDFTVIKLMIDYVGWLGFFCADRDIALDATYKQLSAFFIGKLKCLDPSSYSQLVRLDRKNKLKQAVSRLINAMGLPTHIKTEEDAVQFEKQLASKLLDYPDYPSMIVDQLGIILRQTSLLDACIDTLNCAVPMCSYEFEADLIKNKDTYLSLLFEGSGFQISEIKRKLKPTSGRQSREMLEKLLQIVSFSA